MATIGSAKVNMDMERVMRDVTLELKIIETPRFKFRKWLGIKIIWLATVVLGCRLKVVE